MAGEALAPLIDNVGPQITYISGVTFERLGSQVLVTRYLETMVGGVLVREVVGKDAMCLTALAGINDAARAFIADCLAHPIRDNVLYVVTH